MKVLRESRISLGRVTVVPVDEARVVRLVVFSSEDAQLNFALEQVVFEPVVAQRFHRDTL